MAATALIVVGVDGSPEADQALRFAADEARRTNDAIEVLTAWTLDPSPVSPAALIDTLPTLDQLEDRARRTQADAVRRTLGEAPGVTVSARILRGDAGTLLVDAARHARLLVVGSRSLGPVRAVLLGSVSRFVAQHATCPVAVVPAGAASVAADPVAVR